jgi:hypothetical protein
MSGYYCRECNAIKPLFASPESSGVSPESSGVSPESSGVSPEASGLEIPCLGTVPFDPELARHCDLGIPLAELPESAVSRALDHVVQQLLDSLP